MSEHEMKPPAEGCEGNAAPYVLGALTEEEHEAFRIHLESCAVCREEVVALQVVADALPGTVQQLNTPPELKQRIMSVARQEASLAPPGAAERPARRQGARALSWSISLRPALALGTAALVIAALAVALLVPGGGSSSSTRVITAEVLAPKASASLRVSGGHAELDIADMPQTEPNRVYEVWVKRSGAPQPTNALFTVTAKGSATVGVPGSVSGVKEILVTSEPLGGSKVPTRNPVIVANLS
jgi:anti-sigma-K factor RskA